MIELNYAIECKVELNVKELESGDIQVSWMNGNCIEVISKSVAIEHGLIVDNSNDTSVFPFPTLTEKEKNVLMAIYNQTFEVGLPVETKLISEDTGYTQKSIVGVVSSLYKKNLVESYDVDNMYDEYMITETAFDLLESVYN